MVCVIIVLPHSRPAMLHAFELIPGDSRDAAKRSTSRIASTSASLAATRRSIQAVIRLVLRCLAIPKLVTGPHAVFCRELSPCDRLSKFGDVMLENEDPHVSRQVRSMAIFDFPKKANPGTSSLGGDLVQSGPEVRLHRHACARSRYLDGPMTSVRHGILAPTRLLAPYRLCIKRHFGSRFRLLRSYHCTRNENVVRNRQHVLGATPSPPAGLAPSTLFSAASAPARRPFCWAERTGDLRASARLSLASEIKATVAVRQPFCFRTGDNRACRD